jgi:hypothetical protein
MRGERSFQEYVIRVLPEERKVRVMYADIDSAVELENYPAVVDEFKDSGKRR